MRYAIVSDIHANLEALEVVLDAIEQMDVDEVVSLGDVVGYNANPNECIRLIREHDIPTLMGNHDAVACGITDPVDFNPIARRAVLWTQETLTHEFAEYLRLQPEQRRLGEDACLVHGSMLHRDHYLLSRYDIMENVNRMRIEQPEIRVLFFGHTHHQVAFSCDAEDHVSSISSQLFSLQDDECYLINPGSVGQPRDHDPRAAFLLFDDEERRVEFIRLSYNIQACAKKVLAEGLPRELADRLSHGW